MSAEEYVAIWEFTVRPEALPGFIAAYGPAGDWAHLFQQAPGYRGTLLYQDPAIPEHLVTIDSWQSRDAYESFRRRFAAEYAALDRSCETLTTAERALGAFVPVL